MTAPTPFEQLSCCHETQDGTGQHDDWRPCQDRYMHLSVLSIDDSTNSRVNNGLYGAPTFTGVQNNFDEPVAASNGGFAKIDSRVNGFHQLSGNQHVMSPWIYPDGIPCNQFEGLNWASSIESISGLPDNPTSLSSLQGYSTMNQSTLTEFGSIEALSHVNTQNVGPSDPTSDCLLLPPSISHTLSANSIDVPAVDDYLVDLSMLDSHYEAQNCPPAPVLVPEYQLPSILPFQISAPLDFGGTSLHEHEYWNYPFQGDATCNPLSALTNNLSPITPSDTAHNFFIGGGDFYPPRAAADNPRSPRKAIKPKKHCHIVALPASSPQKLIKGTKATNKLCSRPKAPGRQGRLLLEAKKSTALMRQIGACAHCFKDRVLCSMGEICNRCSKRATGPFHGPNCHRCPLQIYFKTLSPPFLGAHLEGDCVESLTSNLNFVGAEIIADVSTAPSHPPISLMVSEFLPSNEQFLAITDLTLESNDNMAIFGTVNSLPYALREYSIDRLKEKCLNHIEAISHWKHILGDTESLSWKLMRAICRFQEANVDSRQNILLHKVIMVSQIHYAIGHRITFTEKSAPTALKNLQNPPKTPLPHSFLSARVLNRQIKGVFHYLRKELLEEVLNEFAKGLKQKTKDDWAWFLCTFLVLCMCAEDIQIAIDAFMLKLVSDKGGDQSKSDHIRQEGIQNCCKLERYVLEHSWILVQGKLNGVLKKPNIFKDGCLIDDVSSHTESLVNLVDDIRQIMTDHYDEILEAAEDQYYGGSSETVRDHKDFCEYNPGRLVSKILNELLK